MICLCDILDELIVRGIELSRILEVSGNDHLLEHLGRSGDRILCYRVLILELLQELEVFNEGVSLSLYLAYEVCIVKYCKLVVKLYTSSRCLVLYALEAPHEVQVPECSSELTVCDNVESEFLLLSYYLSDLIVDDLIELSFRDLASLKICLCILK